MSDQMQISDAELKEIAAGWPDAFRIRSDEATASDTEQSPAQATTPTSHINPSPDSTRDSGFFAGWSMSQKALRGL